MHVIQVTMVQNALHNATVIVSRIHAGDKTGIALFLAQSGIMAQLAIRYVVSLVVTVAIE